MKGIYGRETGLGDLLRAMGKRTPERRPQGRRPGAEALRAGAERIAAAKGEDWQAEAYGNGYAVYARDGRKTVIWLPDCAVHTWDFIPPASISGERRQTARYHSEIGLLDFPWPVAVMLAGEDRIGKNVERSGRERDTEGIEGACASRWLPGARFEDPLEAILREEERAAVREAVNTLRDGPRAAFHALYELGETQREAAEREGIRAQTVWVREVNLKKGVRARLMGLLCG